MRQRGAAPTIIANNRRASYGKSYGCLIKTIQTI
jgi:hypothetical protein